MRRPLILAASLGLVSCDDTVFGESVDSGVEAWSCDSEDQSTAFVIQQLAFSEAEEGVAWGFDLDGHVSEAGDSQGCGKVDFVDPEGTPGIDNAFAQFFPILANTEAAAVHDLMQTAVNDGELLLVVEVLGLDDAVDDDCVTLRVGMAQGTPLLGTDGFLLDGQTFEPHPEVASSSTDTAAIVDGTVVASPVAAALDLQILDAELNFAFEDGILRGDLDPELSEMVGHFGGGVSVQTIIETLADTGVSSEVKQVLETALPLAADVSGEEGECAYMSVDLQYRAVPAFWAP